MDRQIAAADALADLIGALEASEGLPDVIEIGYPTDDHEAEGLGWPGVSAWRVVAGLALAQLDDRQLAAVRLVPRGLTATTALAADQQPD